jgi:hypothetical protein
MRSASRVFVEKCEEILGICRCRWEVGVKMDQVRVQSLVLVNTVANLEELFPGCHVLRKDSAPWYLFLV